MNETCVINYDGRDVEVTPDTAADLVGRGEATLVRGSLPVPHAARTPGRRDIVTDVPEDVVEDVPEAVISEPEEAADPEEKPPRTSRAKADKPAGRKGGRRR